MTKHMTCLPHRSVSAAAVTTGCDLRPQQQRTVCLLPMLQNLSAAIAECCRCLPRWEQPSSNLFSSAPMP